MAWSIAEVARMSGVSSRALRHYDATGLVTPAYTAANGYRYYEREQLLRLQRVLLLRELGVGLREIKATLDAEPEIGPGWLDALRRHHHGLLAERDRLGRLAQTVARTIDELAAELKQPTTEGTTMTQPTINRPENLFEGFNPAEHEQEARERWPEQAEEAHRLARGFTPEQTEAMQREMTQHIIRMAELMVAGTPADDPAVLDELDWHYRHVSAFWTPSAAAYANLGQMYVDDERFANNYERVATGLAAYTRDAMAAYAAARL
jgi:DNA-binding transcriptional MerR regulator